MTHEQNPNYIAMVRSKLNDSSRDIILLQEVLSYLTESLDIYETPQRPEDEAGSTLFSVLSCATLHNDCQLRANDLQKLVEGAAHELGNLTQMTDVSNTKYLVDASAATERASASLEVMQVILAGSFAFDIVDRISGGSLNIQVPHWVDDVLIKYIISV